MLKSTKSNIKLHANVKPRRPNFSSLALTAVSEKQKFMNATKSLLVKLAAQRKSLRTEERLRDDWACVSKIKKVKVLPELNNIEQPIQEKEKVYRYEISDSKMNQDEQVIIIDQQSYAQEEMQEQADPIQEDGKYRQTKIKQQTQNWEQKKQNKKIRVYPETLRSQILLFLNQLDNPEYKCICRTQNQDMKQSSCTCRRPTAVHRAVLSHPEIMDQIERVREMYKSMENFNEDRLINLHCKGTMMTWMFAKDAITAFEHRAISLLLKRMNHRKFSLSFSTEERGNRNLVVHQFYSEQYNKPVEEYYRELLELEIEHQRYLIHPHEKSKTVIGFTNEKYLPSNGIRSLLNKVFQEKIKGSGEVLASIINLEGSISTSILAQVLLKNMRVQQSEEKAKDQNEKMPTLQENAKDGLEKYIEDDLRSVLKAGTAVTAKQRIAIDKVLEGHRKSLKTLPFPYCLFLENRLRAQNRPSFSNPNNPSSDEDDGYDGAMERQKMKDLNVYKGYRGMKTQTRIRETRKRGKDILKNANLMGEPEHFELGTMEKTVKENKKEVGGVSLIEKNMTERPKEEENRIPFPFNLSIFERETMKIKEREAKRKNNIEALPNSVINLDD